MSARTRDAHLHYGIETFVIADNILLYISVRVIILYITILYCTRLRTHITFRANIFNGTAHERGFKILFLIMRVCRLFAAK